MSYHAIILLQVRGNLIRIFRNILVCMSLLTYQYNRYIIPLHPTGTSYFLQLKRIITRRFRNILAEIHHFNHPKSTQYVRSCNSSFQNGVIFPCNVCKITNYRKEEEVTLGKGVAYVHCWAFECNFCWAICMFASLMTARLPNRRRVFYK